MKAERMNQGINRRFVITSLADDAAIIYDAIYTQRGDMENRTCCHDFQANQFRLLLSSFASVLLHERRRSHLRETKLANAQMHRLRLTLINMSHRVTRSVHRIVTSSASGYPWQAIFRRFATTVRPAPT